jgi:hypothetical protein
MSKRIDFAGERRRQGRALTTAVRELEALVKPLAQEQGIDLQARLEEASARKEEEERRLAERLQESVVPLFISDSEGPPDRVASCVLVRLDSELFAFTAAHVIDAIGLARVFAPSEGRGGKLLPLPECTAHLSPSTRENDLDVALLVLPSHGLGPFERRVFLSGAEIDQNDEPDDQRIASFYMVLGYSASRTQVKVSRGERQIHQRSFRCSTSPVAPAEYLQEKLSQEDHIALDFDHKEIVIERRRQNPPNLQGVSGGGIFHISRATKQGPLVAIATQNRRNARLIVGTRIKHFLSMARELKITSSLKVFP